MFPGRILDARDQLAQVDAKLIGLAGVINGVRQSERAARAIRHSLLEAQDWQTSVQYSDWLEEVARWKEACHTGTETFRIDDVYQPDERVERALKNSLKRGLISMINLGRLLDEGIRRVRQMSLSDFDLIAKKQPVAEAVEVDLVWLAAVRARCSPLFETEAHLFQSFESLEQAPKHRQSDAVRMLDEQIVRGLQLLRPEDEKGTASSLPSAGHLGLIVDTTKRVVRRAGFAEQVNLARSDIGWHLFFHTYQAAGDHARERCKANYPGEFAAVRTAINALNRALKPLDVRVRRYRLITCDHAADRKA
jgi:hypothetical protein